jgi:hypothetical protein
MGVSGGPWELPEESILPEQESHAPRRVSMTQLMRSKADLVPDTTLRSQVFHQDIQA